MRYAENFLAMPMLPELKKALEVAAATGFEDFSRADEHYSHALACAVEKLRILLALHGVDEATASLPRLSGIFRRGDLLERLDIVIPDGEAFCKKYRESRDEYEEILKEMRVHQDELSELRAKSEALSLDDTLFPTPPDTLDPHELMKYMDRVDRASEERLRVARENIRISTRMSKLLNEVAEALARSTELQPHLSGPARTVSNALDRLEVLQARGPRLSSAKS